MPMDSFRSAPVAASTSAMTWSASSRTISSSWTVPDQRDHDLGARVALRRLALRRRLRDGPDLHREQAGDDQAEAHAAQAQHRVLLVQAVDGLEEPQFVLVRLLAGLRQGDADRQFGDVGEELVQRRVQEPDRDREAVHRREQLHEVLLLERKQRLQRLLTLDLRVREDQTLDQLATVAEEHVLRTAQPDALGAEAAGAQRVLGVVRVGAHPQAALAVGERHDPVHGLDQFVGVVGARVHPALEVLHDGGRHDRYLAQVDLARRAVDGDRGRPPRRHVRPAPSSGGAWCRPRAPPRRTHTSCPCLGRPRRRARSCRRGRSGCPPPRSCRPGRRGSSRGGPG